MKKLLLICTCLVVLAGCKKENCPQPVILLTQWDNKVSIGPQKTFKQFAYFEVEYGPSGFQHGSGTTSVITGFQEFTFENNGIYDFYLRANCNGPDWSEWSELKTAAITTNLPYCDPATNLSVSQVQNSEEYEFTWAHTGATEYKVQYGPAGFALGSGTQVSTGTALSYRDGSFWGNNNYEFYVQALCSSGRWSNWTGPKSFYADHAVNQCQTPTNLSATVGIGNNVIFTWNKNGETKWETSLVEANTPANTIQYTTTDNNNTIQYTIPHGSNKYFYVRAICQDGSRSAWSSPLPWQW